MTVDHTEMRQARLDAIIVNWNAGHQLLECIESFTTVAHDHVQLGSVIVVDNSSTDCSLQILGGVREKASLPPAIRAPLGQQPIFCCFLIRTRDYVQVAWKDLQRCSPPQDVNALALSAFNLSTPPARLHEVARDDQRAQQ
jgi:hypothetical protein